MSEAWWLRSPHHRATAGPDRRADLGGDRAAQPVGARDVAIQSPYGRYNSAETSGPEPPAPPTSSTWRPGRSVAIWPARTCVIELVDLNLPLEMTPMPERATGSGPTPLDWVAVFADGVAYR